MPKKQKSKTSNRDRKQAFLSSSSKSASDDDTVCSSIELDLKPAPRKNSRCSSASASIIDDVNNSIDGKHAIIHWSDAYKIDIHNDEPALVVRVIPPSSELQRSGNDNNNFLAKICKVRISPSPSNSSSNSPTKSGTPMTSKKKRSQEVAAACGEILLSSDSLYEYFSPTIAPDGTVAKTAKAPTTSMATPPASTASTKNASFSSPSKSNFSFSKGGGGESLISPSPSKYTSPSGSKFSFTKGGGGGGSFLSPGQSQATPNTHSTTKGVRAKVHLIPLMSLSRQQLWRLCPDAQKLLICPINDPNKSSTINVNLSPSTKIIQTLIISKYQGTYVQAQSARRPRGVLEQHATTPTNIGSKSKPTLETISIPFRGQTETFHIVDVTPAPPRQTNQRDDENALSNVFDQLDISNNSINGQQNNAVTQNESQLLKLIQSHLSSSKNAIAYGVTHQTQVDFVQSLDEINSTKPREILNNIHGNQITKQAVCAGLDSTHARIKDALLPPLLHPNLFPVDGPLRPPKGALLYGPAGVGKSLLAAQIANDLSHDAQSEKKVNVRLVQCADILSSTAIVGEAEKMLSDIFEEAERKATDSAGSLVILDDVHLICPRRGGMGGGSGGGVGVDQLAGTLLALLDGIGSSHDKVERENSRQNPFNGNKSGGGLVVLAITTDPSLLDPALRRPGRLDVEVEVPVPDDEARGDILHFHLSQLMTKQQMDETDIKALARLAKGFTGADCKLAVKEAVRTSISRRLRPINQGEHANGIAGDNLRSGVIEYADLEHAIRITKPSAIKSVAVEVPKVPWSAIGGMESVKALLKESIELPLTHPHLFEMMQVPPPKGILLYGPPGCSKTLMARAIATEGNMNFLAVKGPELLSKWLGESERALASLFRRARLAAPAVIFFDEMDAIASKRGDGGGGGGDRLLSQLLTELDGVTSGGSVEGKGGRVVVVGATNRPDVLDAALTRPGRMDRMIYVGLPDEQGRKSIFEIGLSGKDCHEDVDISAVASDDISKGYSGAEIVALCRDAALHAIGEMDDGYLDRPQIHMRHLLQSIKDTKPRTTKEMLSFYESFRGRR
ncbi:hypothetical protein ACHAXR_011597 [Thalassiosira sp. AJA248-18]